jgi:arsenate reductase
MPEHDPPKEGEALPTKKRVMVLCTANSARSQMAEGLLRHELGDRYEVFSAGTNPRPVRPEAIAVMQELGIDISRQRSKHVDEFNGQHFDYVLRVCDNAQESCPLFPDKTATLHHGFEDPAAFQGSEEERLALFRRVRDEIRNYLLDFASK